MDKSTRFKIVNIGTLSLNKYWGETKRVRTPTATCTLLTVNDVKIIVDPSPHPPELTRFLYATTGLIPEQVDIVFLTHFHGDHYYGLELFPEARWLMAQAGLDEWKLAQPDRADLIQHFGPAESNLPDRIDLLPAPGHTMGLNILGVETHWGYLAITGDAVMTEEYFLAEKGYRNSINFALATETIRNIKSRAKIVIPGHGNIILNW